MKNKCENCGQVVRICDEEKIAYEDEKIEPHCTSAGGSLRMSKTASSSSSLVCLLLNITILNYAVIIKRCQIFLLVVNLNNTCSLAYLLTLSLNKFIFSHFNEKN